MMEIKMQSSGNFSLCGKIWEWDTVSGVGENLGEQLVGESQKYRFFCSPENCVYKMCLKRRGGLS